MPLMKPYHFTRSCADAMHGGEDDWATAEAQLYEALATFCRVETADPDFARIPAPLASIP